MHSGMASRLHRLAILGSALTLLSTGLCLAADFSADTVSKFGTMTASGKLYVRGDSWRQEMNSQGRKMIFIGRGKTVHILNPAAKEYTQMDAPASPWRASAMQGMAGLSGKDIKKQTLGKARVNGCLCDKIVYKQGGKDQGTMTLYVARDLDLAVKTEIKSAQGTMVTEFKNIKKTSPPASLFTVPKDYKKAKPAPPTSGKPMGAPAPGARKK